MTVLLTCKDLTKSHSHTYLFSQLTFSIHKGERIGIIGPNGSGKSTLMKIIVGDEKPDSGDIVYRQSLQVGYVPQFSDYPNENILSVLVKSLEIKSKYHSYDERKLASEIILGKLGFSNFEILASELSGGWKKRFDIAKALVLEPDILLLDEPTNHLDIGSITWLENLLQRGGLTYLVVSHDRLFLDRTANRIIEINRAFPKGLFSAEGNYSTFLEQRTAFLTSLEQYEQSLKSKVRTEIAWLRRSPAARTTKQQARVNQAHLLKSELETLRSIKSKPKEDWKFDSGGMQSRKLLVGKNLTKTLGDRTLFKGLDLQLSPGTRLGIAGDNGSGKTTLLKILAGELKPDVGTVKSPEGVVTVYFDQHREKLPENLTLQECLAPNGDMLEFRGKPIHVKGWAKKFHFHPERMQLPVSELSGGERARILLARLILQPADILLLDEPTNDLDIETLEVLEESLLEFPGAIVLITHDRQMLDTVSTEIIGLGCGLEQYNFAEVAQWEKAKLNFNKETPKLIEKSTKETMPSEKSKIKLTYKEQQELLQIENKIHEAEKNILNLESLAMEPEVQAEPKKLESICHQLADLHHAIDHLFSRWQELESKK